MERLEKTDLMILGTTISVGLLISILSLTGLLDNIVWLKEKIPQSNVLHQTPDAVITPAQHRTCLLAIPGSYGHPTAPSTSLVSLLCRTPRVSGKRKSWYFGRGTVVRAGQNRHMLFHKGPFMTILCCPSQGIAMRQERSFLQRGVSTILYLSPNPAALNMISRLSPIFDLIHRTTIWEVVLPFRMAVWCFPTLACPDPSRR